MENVIGLLLLVAVVFMRSRYLDHKYQPQRQWIEEHGCTCYQLNAQLTADNAIAYRASVSYSGTTSTFEAGTLIDVYEIKEGIVYFKHPSPPGGFSDPVAKICTCSIDALACAIH